MAADGQIGGWAESGTPLPVRILRVVRTRLRPALGWGAFLIILILAAMPAFTLRSTAWVEIPGYDGSVALAGPLGVIAAWLMLGWRRAAFFAPRPRWIAVILSVVYVLLGLLLVIQLTAGWLPSPLTVWRMWENGNWFGPWQHVLLEMGRLVTRVDLWRQGVLAGGAAQDNLVVAFLFAIAFWAVAGGAVILARRTQRGLIIALPLLWIVMVQLAYGSMARGAFVYAILLTILLHLVLDQERMTARWVARGMDYNAGIGAERVLAALLVVVGIVGVAAVFPNIYVAPIAQAYYDYMVPLNQQIEDNVERVLPDAQGTSSRRRGGVGGGMPNDFLLAGGPTLRQIEVLRYRTNEPYLTDIPFEEIGPPSHYMRGGTFSEYNGRGWSNPNGMVRTPFVADENRFEELPGGRRELVQSVIMAGTTQILYAAPELMEASVDFRLETRAENDVVAAWSRAQSYTVVSAIPAVSEAELLTLPVWEAEALTELGLGEHLALPDTISDRTRALAAEIAQEHESAYARAAAIEAYLRTYEYDLEVPGPPRAVEDIADYFLFDLQRGYCDYYATAFVVLARLVGLPTRFATGFSGGYWNPGDMSHVVTEADAHSWAEVYFPEAGWIPFEPTAARPLLLRIGNTSFTGTGSSAAVPQISASETGNNELQLTWQVWLWLVPLLGLAWLGLRFAVNRWGQGRDSWHELLAWGQRLGRPIQPDETPLEYGRELGDYVTARVRTNQDTGRLVAREMRQLGVDISDARYGPEAAKLEAETRADARWTRLCGYRRTLRVNKLLRANNQG
ncbi:MAG: transglutaminaseTgpA domain-containing protein [Litorilinea sp.]